LSCSTIIWGVVRLAKGAGIMALSSGSGGSGQRDGGPVEAAGYLAEAIGELIQIVQAHRLDMLCYLLDMARLEAREVVRLRGRRRSHSK